MKKQTKKQGEFKKMKEVNFWKCLNCGKEFNSNNVLREKTDDGLKVLNCFVMKCPFCKTIDNPFNKDYLGENKIKGFIWLRKESLLK